MSTDYYKGRERLLAEVFGATSVQVLGDAIVVDERRYAVVDDVIVTLAPDRLPPRAAAALGFSGSGTDATRFAKDIQLTFGDEWWEHGELLPEHEQEFSDYFDLVDLGALGDSRVADLGCGSGRWASFVAPRCRELVVVDFSDAVFVARMNLRAHDNVVFVLGDVLELPFAADAFDFAYCLGVLHHLPVDALDACRRVAPIAPKLLVYLYYSLENRPAHYRALLVLVTALRRVLARIRNRRARAAITWILAATVYAPLSWIGAHTGLRGIPLADTYAGKSLRRMQQDVYDRFFTRIEQRFSREQIMALLDTFEAVDISQGLPYWHFLCEDRRR